MCDDGNNFYVIEAAGSQIELYEKAHNYLNLYYWSVKNAISESKPNSITVRGFSESAIHRNSMHILDMDYVISFEFKDGKIKFTPSEFIITKPRIGEEDQTLHLIWSGFSVDGSDLGIYGKNGKLKTARAKSDVEEFFNDYMKKFIEGLNRTDW